MEKKEKIRLSLFFSIYDTKTEDDVGGLKKRKRKKSQNVKFCVFYHKKCKIVKKRFLKLKRDTRAPVG